MEISFAGALVIGALFLVGHFLGSALIVPSIASFAFAATAIVSVSAVGGASPLIYVVPGIAIIASVASRRDLMRDLMGLLTRDATALIVVLLTVYVVGSAFIMPRLFQGQTSVFVSTRESGLAEIPLGPTPGNITQTAYFVLGALTFLCYGILLERRSALRAAMIGFFLWSGLNAAMGAIDLGGKVVGAGDLLQPIRTAAYAYITGEDVVLAGFFRISGAHSEASSFAGAALAGLAFNLEYWRRTGSKIAGLLALVLLALLLLATSTTGYVGFVVLAFALAMAMTWSGATKGFKPQDLVILALLVVGIAVLLASYLANENAWEPFVRLFQTTVLDKGVSDSAHERGYWNARSLLSVLDTSGLGMGLGSSRASNWAIAVASQLGVVGTALLFAVVAYLARMTPRAAVAPADLWIAGLHNGARICAVSMLVTQTIAGSGADPGTLFFIALATVLACRCHLAASAGGIEDSVEAGRAVWSRAWPAEAASDVSYAGLPEPSRSGRR